jgi:hypothetical protein
MRSRNASSLHEKSLGHRHDQAKIGSDHLVLGMFSVVGDDLELVSARRSEIGAGAFCRGQQPRGVHAGLDALGQLHLLLRGQQLGL